MPAMNRIFGWTPTNSPTASNDQDPSADAAPSRSQPHLQILTFQSSPQADSPHADSPPYAGDAPSPASSASSELPHDVGTLSDHEPEPPRRGDPAWVARPRNPFIIFRCQYSQKHCKEGKRVRRPPGVPPEKSLSKRAAEAWHTLSPEEKEHFKELANTEKDEHARLHPLYRFRPAKRYSKSRRGSLAGMGSSLKQEVMPPPAMGPIYPNPSFVPPLVVVPSQDPQLVSPVLVCPETMSPFPSRSPQPILVVPSQQMTPPPPPPRTKVVTRQRSYSQPIPMAHHVNQSPYASSGWVVQGQRPDIKRTRSATGNWAHSAVLSHSHAVISPGSSEEYNPSSGYYTPLSSSPTAGSLSPLTEDFAVPHLLPHATNASNTTLSSLANWNGIVDAEDCLSLSSSTGHSPTSPSSSPWMNLASLSIASPSIPLQDYATSADYTSPLVGLSTSSPTESYYPDHPPQGLQMATAAPTRISCIPVYATAPSIGGGGNASPPLIDDLTYPPDVAQYEQVAPQPTVYQTPHAYEITQHGQHHSMDTQNPEIDPRDDALYALEIENYFQVY